MNARERYKRATRRIRADSIPANSSAAWRIICEEFDIDLANGIPWGSQALEVQSHLQTASYPNGSLAQSLAHNVLNGWGARRYSPGSWDRRQLANRLLASGKAKRISGGYLALTDDDSDERQNEWRERGRTYD